MAGTGLLALSVVPVTVLPLINTALALGNKSVGSFVATAGWLIVVWGIRLLFTGRLITGREADERDERYAAKDKECQELRSAVATMADGMEVFNSMIRELLEEDRARRRYAPRDTSGAS